MKMIGTIIVLGPGCLSMDTEILIVWRERYNISLVYKMKKYDLKKIQLSHTLPKTYISKKSSHYDFEDYSPQIKSYKTDVGELKLPFPCVGGQGNEGGSL